MSLKGALIGFGRVAEAAHLPAFAARASSLRLVAVAEAGEERLKAAQAALPGARAYRSAEELFQRETELDFAVIATPPASHVPLARMALSKGLHALVEKPLTLEPSDLPGLRALSERAGRCLYTVHNWRSAPAYEKMAGLSASGALGKVRHVELHTLRTRPAAGESGWRAEAASGGIVVDHGWHAFYLLRALAGAEALRVSAFGAGQGAADAVTVLVEGDGFSGSVHLSWAAPARSNWALAYGEKGSSELRDDHLLFQPAGRSAQRFDFDQAVSQGSAHPDWMERMLEDFLAETADASLRGRNLQEAEACARLTAGARESLKLGGRPVDLRVPAKAEATA